MPAHDILGNYLKWCNFKKCRNASAANIWEELIKKKKTGQAGCGLFQRGNRCLEPGNNAPTLFMVLCFVMVLFRSVCALSLLKRGPHSWKCFLPLRSSFSNWEVCRVKFPHLNTASEGFHFRHLANTMQRLSSRICVFLTVSHTQSKYFNFNVALKAQ